MGYVCAGGVSRLSFLLMSSFGNSSSSNFASNLTDRLGRSIDCRSDAPARFTVATSNDDDGCRNFGVATRGEKASVGDSNKFSPVDDENTKSLERAMAAVVIRNLNMM